MLPYNYVNKIWTRSKSRAKKSGIPFTITIIDIEDLSVPLVCPVLGIPMNHEPSSSQQDDSISIDRIDSTRGYEPDNIVLISWRANFLKSNGTLDELISLGKWCEEIKSIND